jgi:hypothetical protein
MKSLLALLAIALLSLDAVACGGSSKGTDPVSQASSNAAATGSAPATTASSTTPAMQPVKSDNDNDGDNGEDDFNWGQAASAADSQAATALVKRYYAVAAAGDGAMACALIYSIFAEEISEVYGQPPGPAALRGKTCAAVMSKLFKQERQQLIVDNATLEVARVRVKEKRGLVLLSFKGMPQRNIPVHRELGAWKIDALLDSGLG